MRSRVLNGQTVAEYDAAGVRQAAYVFMGTALLAQQERMFDGATRVLWRHQNPVTGDGLDTDIQGKALGRPTVDPMVDGTTPLNYFTGDPLSNGRMGARRLNAIGGSDENKAIKYTKPSSQAARKTSYESYAGRFRDFFNCYHPQ